MKEIYKIVNNCNNCAQAEIIAMDSTDIPAEVFHSIFIQPDKCSRDTAKLIVEWNQSFDPSFNIVKSQFRKFIQKNPNNAEFLSHNVTKTIEMMVECKCPRNFMRGYLATIKSILEEEQGSPAKNILNSNLEEYRSKWQQINIEVLEAYFDAFLLKNKVSQQQVNQFIARMIEKKKYNKCLDFIKFLGVAQNKDNIEKLMAKMSNKRDASKAADYVKQLKLDPKNYPALGERLYKNTARHFLTKHGWEYAEQIFEQYPQALACVVQDLIYKKKIAEARSIWSRHPLWDYLQKDDSKEVLKQEYKGQILENPIISNDVFGPPGEKFISLSNFGIKQEDVIWVDNQTKQLDEILKDILSAQSLGIDTESIVGQTKFQKVDEAAIIQVSTGKKIYIFDGFKSNNPKITQAFLKCFQQKKIIGHSFTNDVEGMMKGLGLPENQQVKIKNLIDICKVYKGLNQNSKYSSLAHICKQVFGKQLCKDQTLTNWKRRPLRKNQTHYAALDAHVVVQVYNAWIKQYGMIVHYHANIDEDQI